MRLVAKHGQVGYQSPGERPGCRNCTHAELYRPESGVCYNAPRMSCTRHHIEITSGGICPDHHLQRRRNESQQDFLRRQGDLFGKQVPARHGETDQVEHLARLGHTVPHVGEIEWSLA